MKYSSQRRGKLALSIPVIKLMYISEHSQDLGGQFHQHFTSSFFEWKCFEKLFSNYAQCGFVIFSKIILVQKMLVKCWWSWLKVNFSNICLQNEMWHFCGTRFLVNGAQILLTTQIWLAKFSSLWQIQSVRMFVKVNGIFFIICNLLASNIEDYNVST